MATSEQFSLRWNNFHSNLTTGFHDLLEASDLVDVTFAIDGRFLLAHKIVLSICSPYFKQMFKMNPCNHPIVILKDVTHDNMKDILEFMYVGEVNVLRENLPSFLRTAELLQVKGLTGEDTQSETSSKKDEKQDSICGEQEEDQDLSQMFEAENMRLPQFSPDLSIPLKKTQANKRNSKQILNSSKRTKIDNNNVNKPNKCIMEEDVIPDQPNIKLESVYDFDEQKETIKSFDGNSVNCSSDTNMQDHADEEIRPVLKINKEKPSPEISTKPTQIIAKLSPEISAKFSSVISPKPSPQITAKPSHEIFATSPENSAEPSPQIIANLSPEIFPKPSPKITVKSSPKITVKSFPKTTVKSSPKITVKSSPKITLKSFPKITVKPSYKLFATPPKNSAETSPQITAKLSPEIFATPPKISAKPSPENSAKLSPVISSNCSQITAKSSKAFSKPSHEIFTTPPEVSAKLSEIAPKPSEIFKTQPEICAKPSEISSVNSTEPPPQITAKSSPEIFAKLSPEITAIPDTSPKRIPTKHFPREIPRTEKKNRPTQRCILCDEQDSKGKKIGKETRYYCADCKVALCIIPCFKNYHIALDSS